MFKKFTISFLLSIYLLFTFSVPYAFAQNTNPWYNQSWKEWYVKVYDEQVSDPTQIFGERYTAAQVSWVMYGLGSFVLNQILGGLGPNNNRTDLVVCVFNTDLDACFRQVGLITDAHPNINTEKKPVLATLFPEDRSFSGVNYVRSKLSHLKIIPEAEAQTQGFGFNALSPVINIWKAFRDVMYGFFVIIIIVFAFMIMFRVKLSPQTAVTVQSALPKVIITLILVTFSYAIAGFMIDLMYVVIGLLAYIANTSGIVQPVGGWTTVFNSLTMGPIPTIGGGILGWIFLYLGGFFAGVIFAFFGAAGILTTIISLLSLGLMPMLIGFILTLIMAIILLWTVIKILWMMLKVYITILILVIFAPLYIGFGAIVPSLGFGKWLKSLLANLAIYPVVGTMILLAIMFLGAAFDPLKHMINNVVPLNFMTFGGGGFWYPPLTFGVQDHLLGFDPLPLLWLMASAALMMMIPKAGDIIKSMIEGRPFAYGSAIGEAIGSPWATIRPYTWDSMAGREIREQAGVLAAIRAMESGKAYVPEAWKRTRTMADGTVVAEGTYAKLLDKLKRRGGF